MYPNPIVPWAVVACFALTPRAWADVARPDRASTWTAPVSALMLIDDFERYRFEHDELVFRQRVSAHYSERSLTRLMGSPDPKTRRAVVFALGLTGSIDANAALARALRDPDPAVRAFGDQALWSLWFRADSAENNSRLEEVAALISMRRLEQAIEAATKLIARAPGFAEAYNQRAIARFFLGRYRESSEDCKLAIARNPFHTGALSGLAQCQLELDLRHEALESLRRASSLQPYNEELKQTILALEDARP